MRTLVLSLSGSAAGDLDEALRRVSGGAVIRRVGWRRPVGARVAKLAPQLIFIDEPAWAPLPLAVIREARSAAPDAVVIVRAAEPTADWLYEALLAGASAVLPALADGGTLGVVVEEALQIRASERAADRVRWAASETRCAY